MITQDELIECIKGQIREQVINKKIETFENIFGATAKTYLWTNEFIDISSSIIKEDNYNNLLCVTGSGDQILNFVHNGITNIETFDINLISEYILNLKICMILNYSYEEFKSYSFKLTFGYLNEYTNVLNDIIKYLDKKNKHFWQEIINYNYKIQKENNTNLNLIYLICVNNLITFNNNYLLNEKEYNKLKNNLNNVIINFKRANAYNLNDYYDNKFDIIYLSNILDYFYRCIGINWKIDSLNCYLKRIDNLLEYGGILYINYIFYYTRTYPLFKKSNIYKKDLNDDLKVIKLPKTNDAILIRRKE